MGFLLRWFFAFALIAATFNPTRWNYSKWVSENFTAQMPLAVFLGLLLFIGYVVYLRATLRSIGGFGMGLVFAVFAALIWLLWDWGVLSFTNSSMNVWLGILSLSLVLGIGLSWSFVRRAISGQYDVDDNDE